MKKKSRTQVQLKTSRIFYPQYLPHKNFDTPPEIELIFPSVKPGGYNTAHETFVASVKLESRLRRVQWRPD